MTVIDKNAKATSKFVGSATPMAISKPAGFFGSFHECFLAPNFYLNPQTVDFEWVTVTDWLLDLPGVLEDY